MKKKFDFRIIIVIALIVILVIMLCFYNKSKNSSNNYTTKTMTQQTNTTTNAENASTSTSSIKSTGQVISSLEENIDLHATYYFEESYVEENEYISAGENILKYTNGEYLTAPYNCVVTKLNVPSAEGKCTNEHYVTIESTNTLAIEVKVDETEIGNLSVGQDATVSISAYENKTFAGYITNISNTASSGKFTVTIEFENDGNVKIGMTASVVV